MSEIIQYSRVQMHRWTTPGVVPTIPTTDDVTSDAFLSTDLKNGEFAVNIPDEKAWFRAGSSIVEITTGGAITPPDLATVLLYGNTTGANHLFVGTTKALKSGNGNGQIDLDYGGSANEVMVSTDAGAYGAAMLYLTNGYVELSDYTANSGLSMMFSGLVNIGALASVTSGLGDTKGNVGVYNSASATIDLIAAGGNMDNTVIIGGTGITAKESNAVYTPTVVVQTGKAIKSGNAGGQIDLDYGGIAGNILISTDNATATTPYVYVTPTNINLVAGSVVNLSLESLNNRITINNATGFVLGRMTTTEKLALTGVNGMIVYDTTLNKFQGYEAGSWVNLV